MHSVDHALSIIGEKLAIPHLSFNPEGQVELSLGETLKAHLTRITPTVVELSFRLPRLSYAKPSMMREMLTANFLGSMTGPGRLAIDPAKEGVIYCERWNVVDMTADSVEQRLQEFIRHGAYWLTTGSDDLIAAGQEDLLGLNGIFAEIDDDGELVAPLAPPVPVYEDEEPPVLFRL